MPLKYCYDGVPSRTVTDNKTMIHFKRFGHVQERRAVGFVKAVSFRAPVNLGVKRNTRGSQHLPPSVKLSLPTVCLHYKRGNTLNEKQAHVGWKLLPQQQLFYTG